VLGGAYARLFPIVATVLSAVGLLAAPGAGGALDASGGALDHSFGNRGLARIDGIRSCLPGEGGCPMSVGLVIHPDGAVLVAAGTLDHDCRSGFALARLREGKLDRRFGRGGWVLTRFGSSSAVATAMVATPDGGVVVAGELKAAEGSTCVDPTSHIHLGGTIGFALARYHRDGTLDTTFGENGRVVTNVDETGAVDVLLQDDGKVVVVGSSANRLVLARYDRRGTLDPSFGSNGTVFSDLGSYPGPGGAAPDGSGRILVSNSPGCTPCPSSVLRFTPDGRLDLTFGRDGRAFVGTRSVRLSAIAVTGKRIVAAGVEWSSRRLIVARFTSSGGVDLSFGRAGIASVRVPRVTFVNDVAVQRNRKIVVLTTFFPFKRPTAAVDFTLTRLLPNGSVDRTFGEAGKATADFGFSDVGEAVAIQPDGKLVVAGVIGDRPGPYRADALGVARFLP
jgi:uncharacterized delta-60 repeat protein